MAQDCTVAKSWYTLHPAITMTLPSVKRPGVLLTASGILRSRTMPSTLEPVTVVLQDVLG